MTHMSKINSPYPIFLLKNSSRFPLEITMTAPIKDKMIPANLYFVNFSLKTIIENKVIKEGFKETIIAARLAATCFNPMKKKKLKPATPVNPRHIINKNCEKLIRGNLPYFLTTNIIRNKVAAEKRKKDEVKGERFAAIIFPEIKLLPQNKDINNNLIYIILFSANVFKILPP